MIQVCGVNKPYRSTVNVTRGDASDIDILYCNHNCESHRRDHPDVWRLLLELRTLDNPPKDIELNILRSPLSYTLVYPDDGVVPDTGLLFWIVPWGMNPTHEYSQDKLMPHMANTSNCIVVALEYHGMKVKCGSAKFGYHQAWPQMMHERYGTPLVNDVDAVIADMIEKGMTHIDMIQELALQTSHEGDYLSWGLLPALDYIAVLGEILKSHNVNRKKLILFGSSYGGYIVSMILKLMPNTFSCAIENSGFTGAVPKEMNNQEFSNPVCVTRPDGFSFPAFAQSPWTFTNPDAPNYFKPEYTAIRDLLQVSHFTPSQTPLYSFHSTEDEIVPWGPKVTFCTFRKSFAPTFQKFITPDDIDGNLFKTMTHGMNASMKGLFDLVCEQQGDLAKARTENDFDDETHLEFECGDSTYVMDYATDGTFDFKLVPTEKANA